MFATALKHDPTANPDECIDDLAGSVAGLAALDPEGLSDGKLSEVLVSLRRQASALEAATARLTGAWDARRVWARDGARSGGAWLAHRTRMSGPAARRQVRLAREVRTMPEAEEAWGEGEISSEHVSALCRVRTGRTEEAFSRDEELLVGHARRLSFAHFQRLLAYWREHADPDGAEGDAQAAFDERRLFLSQSFQGAWRLDGDLDAVGGTEFYSGLERIERELFRADWEEAKAIHGDDVSVDQLARTPAQRRADALVEMARRAATAPKGGKRPRPLVTFHVSYEKDNVSRLVELANGTPVTLGQVARMIREADIERAVFGPDSRVIDLGRTSRLFTGAARRALEIAHRRCDYPGCTRTGPHREANHIVPWEEGGRTDQVNGHLPCDPHHDLLNKRRAQPFTVRRDENGRIHWYRPDGTEIT